MGNQGRCDEGYRRLCEYLWAGAIGDVVETHSWSGFVNGGAGGRPPANRCRPGTTGTRLGPAPTVNIMRACTRLLGISGSSAPAGWGIGAAATSMAYFGPSSRVGRARQMPRDHWWRRREYPQASVIRWNIPARPAYLRFSVLVRQDSSRPPTPPKTARVPFGAQLPADAGRIREEVPMGLPRGLGWRHALYRNQGMMHAGCYGQRPGYGRRPRTTRFPCRSRASDEIRGPHFGHFIPSYKEGKPTCADFSYASAITEFLLLGHLAIKAGPESGGDSPNLRCPNLPELDRWVKRDAARVGNSTRAESPLMERGTNRVAWWSYMVRPQSGPRCNYRESTLEV